MSPQSQQHTVEVAESPVKLAYALEWETEFLLSFYGREVTYFNVGRDGSIQMDLILENPDDPHCPLLYFNFFLPAEYPSVKPKYEVTAGTYLTPKETDNLALTLERVTDRHLGSEAIHALVESARQFMLNGRFGFEGRRAKTFKASNHETVPSVRPTILTGHCITDRSSSFQGHVAKVGSLQNVHDVMEVIKHTRKIKRAKHNCYAFR